MTGSRDIEGMFIFTVGRVINAWLEEEIRFAFHQAEIHVVMIDYL